jgi:D-3-phosphoglycerate dehydrogenase
MPHVLIAGAIHGDGLAVLKERADVTVEVIRAPTEDDFLARLGEADALIIRTARLPRQAVGLARRLKVVARHGVGYDNIPVDALDEHRIPLALVGNVNAVTVAEHTLFMMLALAKQALAHDRAVRQGAWGVRERFAAWELAGRRLLLLGFGRVGREVAVRAAAFTMVVEAFDPGVPAAAMEAAGVRPVADWRLGLAQADVVSLHVPLTPATQGMIAEAELALMKPGAVLLNMARGGLVDEAALARALAAGRLGGAGIDVFEEEPPSPASPLLAEPRALLSPHSAGLTEECAARMGIVSARNALAGIDGRLEPALVVNRHVLEMDGK